MFRIAARILALDQYALVVNCFLSDVLLLNANLEHSPAKEYKSFWKDAELICSKSIAILLMHLISSPRP